ncbi:restriction endonuclease subunit S [Rhizobium sp. RU36D]|uniref:restriction endonuclease subunit S n=1 Tax=Rhizobium sp. RU36D TaxID=1907415 RepID=UPI0009D81BC2|nr:restriction endonuclease subunit S [Rhizobium sp. RU36D]SMD19977.1 type I restriction enzyme, S subunit [Rhizobium sp. RU36D]
MEAHQFLAEFGHIANAPGGVARLRELVLQLAISGRLVERGTMETPVSESLRLAAAQRQRYERDLDMRATRLQPPIEAFPYAIPSHWQWLPLERLSLYVQRGKGPKYAERGSVSVVSQKCIQWTGFRAQQARFVADDSIAGYGPERFLCNGDLLWNSTGTGTVGRVAEYSNVLEKRFVADSHVTVIRLSTAAIPRYVWCVIAAPWVQARIQPTHPDSLVSGTTQQVELSTSAVRSLPIPCPPVEEQSRIVAKVDELMTLCEQLEAQQQDRRKLQNALRQSTLQALASAQSPHELKESWQRLQTNFGRLCSEPRDVQDLRSLFVELAIRGALSPTDDRETTDDAGELLKSLAKLKSGKRYAKLTPVDFPFELPTRWRWALFDDLLQGSESGWSPKCDAEARRPGEWGVLKVSAVTWGEFRPDENKRLPPSLDPRPECEVKPGDFLLSRANTAELVARSVISESNMPDRLLMSDKIIRLKFIDPALKRWANLVNNSQFAREHYRTNATGTSDSMRNVSRQVIHELPIPLPPRDVQDAVIEKLAQLNELCNSLEKQMKEAALNAERLSSAAVSTLTGISIENENEAPVKAPQTELIAPLRLGMSPDMKAQAPLANLLARHDGEMSARDLWQRFGGEIDAFYAQLKTEVTHGWIEDPSYVLDPNAPDSAKKYPDGTQVAKMKIKQEA